MPDNKDKVHSLEEYKKFMQRSREEKSEDNPGARGRASLLLAGAALLVAVVAGLLLNARISGLEERTRGLGGLSEQVAALSRTVDAMDDRTRQMVMDQSLAEIAGSLEFLGDRLEGERAVRISRAAALLRQDLAESRGEAGGEEAVPGPEEPRAITTDN